MSGGKQTSTSTSSNQPLPSAMPVINQVNQDAGTLYRAGVGSQPYMGSTVIPDSKRTRRGTSWLDQQAMNNRGGMGVSGFSQDVINNGGMTSDQLQSMEYLNSVGTNAHDLSGNETYQAYKAKNLEEVSNQVKAMASSHGRYGSGMHTGAAVDALSDASIDMDMSQFARNDNLNNMRFNAGQTAMGNVGSAYELGQLPARTMMELGARDEDLAGRLKNDELRIFDGIQNAPWRNASNAMAAINGSSGYGTSTTTAQQPGQNPFLQAAGLGLSGAGLFGGF